MTPVAEVSEKSRPVCQKQNAPPLPPPHLRDCRILRRTASASACALWPLLPSASRPPLVAGQLHVRSKHEARQAWLSGACKISRSDEASTTNPERESGGDGPGSPGRLSSSIIHMKVGNIGSRAGGRLWAELPWPGFGVVSGGRSSRRSSRTNLPFGLSCGCRSLATQLPGCRLQTGGRGTRLVITAARFAPTSCRPLLARGVWGGCLAAPAANHHEGTAGQGGIDAAVSQQVWKAAVCFLCSFHGC